MTCANAVSREDGELLEHVLGAAIRTVGIVTVPDELLEMRLALHAHVLVDRHRRESLGSHPDGPQIASRPARGLAAHPGAHSASTAPLLAARAPPSSRPRARNPR